ncbi:MAG TPA: sugar ABC transporter ATP-binding protein [Candidatus Deferrimicrobium sp.]|nr:sugar ABC transporter ATP-binding protein [Candidatus Deferrimicrobium sp.]
MTVQVLGTGSEAQAAGPSGPVLSLQHISKTYPGTRALVDVSFDLSAGEVHSLIGENGAGKSTLMKILAGVVPPDRGAIILRGEEHQHLTPRSALQLGVSTIYQESDIVTSLTVADNVFLGQEPVRAVDVVDTRQQGRITRAIIEDLGVDLDPDELGARLSPAQRQLTMIVRALRFSPDVLILDEPTSSLGQAETEHLLSLVRRLAERGLGIIYISHYLEEVLRVADRITVLKDGRHVATLPAAGATAEGLVHLMVGRDASAFFVKEAVPIGDVLMRVEDYSGPGVPEPVTFEVRRGEVLGIGGLVGAGRTELLELLFGVRKPLSGTIHIDGRASRPRSPREAVAAGLSLVTEDRARSGLFPERTVRENLATAWNELRGAVVRGERSLANGIVDRLGIVTPSIEQEVKRLSGGNQQKVLIGRWLAVDAQVYMFDEPTKGVDIGAKHDIYGFIAELLKAGRAVIIVSSDLPELLSISDRIAIMRNGRIISMVAAAEATEQSLMKEFLGVTAD